MKDRLEQFIIEQKEQLDVKNPPEGLWQRIAQRLNQSVPERRSSNGFLWKAAAITFFALSTYLIWDKIQDQGIQREIIAASNEFSDIESYYFSEIDLKIERIQNLRSGSVKPGPDFGENLGKLDAMYKVLKDQYADDPSKEVIDAMILNLIMRIDLINQQLFDLQEDNQEEIEQST